MKYHQIQSILITKIKILGALILTIAFCSCDINQSVNKDLITGAYSRGDGISCSKVRIKVNEVTDNRNKFSYGEKVEFTFHKVTGLTVENGRIYSGLSLSILKNDIDTVMHYPDLLSDPEGTKAESPLAFSANFVAALPYRNNETYEVFINFWDKKSAGTFTYNMPFTVEESKLLNINNQGVAYEQIYLWDDTKKAVVTDKEINPKNKYILIFEGLDGLKAQDNKVYPALSIDLTDKNKKAILSNENILAEYETKGLDQDKFYNQKLPLKITFPTQEIENPYLLEVSFYDLKSENRIDIKTELTLQ